MTVEELKDLMICLIEEGKENDVIAYRKDGVVQEIALAQLFLISPASDFLCLPDLDRFDK